MTTTDDDRIVGLWHFDEANARTAADFSGHKHAASLFGDALVLPFRATAPAE